MHVARHVAVHRGSWTVGKMRPNNYADIFWFLASIGLAIGLASIAKDACLHILLILWFWSFEEKSYEN